MRRPGPGRYEACEDLRLAQVLERIINSGLASEQAGDLETQGHFSLIERRGPGFYVVEEDSRGFLTYARHEEGSSEWEEILEYVDQW